MDISKEYIEMCRKATKIQEAWKPVRGDLVYISKDNEFNYCGWFVKGKVLVYDEYNSISEVIKADCIFIPRQDQLQDMILTDTAYWEANDEFVVDSLLDKLMFFTYGCTEEYYNQFKSAEQLWLAFVMKEKYKKVWNGSQWVQA